MSIQLSKKEKAFGIISTISMFSSIVSTVLIITSGTNVFEYGFFYLITNLLIGFFSFYLFKTYAIQYKDLTKYMIGLLFGVLLLKDLYLFEQIILTGCLTNSSQYILICEGLLVMLDFALLINYFSYNVNHKLHSINKVVNRIVIPLSMVLNIVAIIMQGIELSTIFILITILTSYISIEYAESFLITCED